MSGQCLKTLDSDYYRIIVFQILHFFNTPPDITEEQLIQVIEEKEVKKPSQVKLFPKKGMWIRSGLHLGFKLEILGIIFRYQFSSY